MYMFSYLRRPFSVMPFTMFLPLCIFIYMVEITMLIIQIIMNKLEHLELSHTRLFSLSSKFIQKEDRRCIKHLMMSCAFNDARSIILFSLFNPILVCRDACFSRLLCFTTRPTDSVPCLSGCDGSRSSSLS